MQKEMKYHPRKPISALTALSILVYRFYVKSKLKLFTWIGIHYVHLKEEHLSIVNWKSSEQTPLTFILKKQVPVWADKSKSAFECNQVILFIATDKVFKLYNYQIGIDISNEQPYYLKGEIPILYHERQTRFLKRLLYLQQHYKMSINAKAAA
jgi:hypothetical protein